VRLTDDVVADSGLGLSLWSEGDADTEIALYRAEGTDLVACNDDGHSGSWGDPELNSRLDFGDAEGAPSNGDGWNGYTIQHYGIEFNNPRDLPAGHYTIVVATYSVHWDELEARATEEATRGGGDTTVHLAVFEVP